MFYLIFKYKNYSISLHRYCYELGSFFHFTPTEAAWAEPCSCTEIILNLLKRTLKSVVTCIIKRSSIKLYFTFENYNAAGTLSFPDCLNKPEIILNLSIDFLIIFRTNDPRVFKNFGAFVLLTFPWCSLSHKASFFSVFFFFFFLYEREWRKQIHAVEW